MRVGIFISNAKPDYGGAYTFEQDLLNALGKSETHHELFVFYYGRKNQFTGFPPNIHFVSILEGDTIFKKFFRKTRRLADKLVSLIRETEYIPNSNLKIAARKYRIDLMWFMSLEYEACGVPFIYTLWDLAHKFYPFFPEVSESGWKWEEREKHYDRILMRATCIFTGSEEGKRQILRYYPVQEEKIKIIPLPLPSYILEKKDEKTNADFLLKNGISRPYLFYPAQFWPHKNHLLLLNAVKLLAEKHHLNFSLVFCGADKGNKKYIRQKAVELKIEIKVICLDYVAQEELVALYKNAFALTFPSFFGPDNLPPLEAFALGCPVVAADIPGAKEQLGDAALFASPLGENEFADAIKMLHDAPLKRSELIAKGKMQADKYKNRDYISRAFSVINEFEKIRARWE